MISIIINKTIIIIIITVIVIITLTIMIQTLLTRKKTDMVLMSYNTLSAI